MALDAGWCEAPLIFWRHSRKCGQDTYLFASRPFSVSQPIPPEASPKAGPFGSGVFCTCIVHHCSTTLYALSVQIWKSLKVYVYIYIYYISRCQSKKSVRFFRYFPFPSINQFYESRRVKSCGYTRVIHIFEGYCCITHWPFDVVWFSWFTQLLGSSVGIQGDKHNPYREDSGLNDLVIVLNPNNFWCGMSTEETTLYRDW